MKKRSLPYGSRTMLVMHSFKGAPTKADVQRVLQYENATVIVIFLDAINFNLEQIRPTVNRIKNSLQTIIRNNETVNADIGLEFVIRTSDRKVVGRSLSNWNHMVKAFLPKLLTDTERYCIRHIEWPTLGDVNVGETTHELNIDMELGCLKEKV